MPRRSGYLLGLGTLFLAVGAGMALYRVATGGLMQEALLEFVLVGFSGLLIVYVGRWLASSEIDPDLYSRIVYWCLGGIGVMLIFLLVRALHPGIENPFSHSTRAIALVFGSGAGLAIGIHETRALTRERELDRQNRKLRSTRDNLEAAIQQIEASNEQLEHFASIASHDLREPLRMVKSYLSLIETRYGEQLDTDGQEFLEFAVDGADRMQAMIESLLAYSRIETQAEPFELVNLNDVFETVVADLQLRIEERDAEIVTTDLPLVRGDKIQLRQVFQNLLSNAIEYSEGRPTVSVAAERTETEWLISVQDEGIGIDPAAQERIFEIFHRAHGTGTHEGSGIGLALCHRIVERHHGTIGVQSEPGVGSTFSFTIPHQAEMVDPVTSL